MQILINGLVFLGFIFLVLIVLAFAYFIYLVCVFDEDPPKSEIDKWWP